MNNPKSILPAEVRSKLLILLVNDIDRLYEELDKLHGAEYIEAYLLLNRVFMEEEPI